jgi:hypothetical protein
MYRFGLHPTQARSIESAYVAIDATPHPPTRLLVPLFPIDEAAIACIDAHGNVVRWLLDEVPEQKQAALFDTDAGLFIQSVACELAARVPGLTRMLEVVREYSDRFAQRDEVPRATDRRPIRLACQNVIVGLASLKHDRDRSALQVDAWQTCEAPHLATHEANRALAALTLCDAYRAGGTMEIVFDTHPEGTIPASLRRYARTKGIDLPPNATSVGPDQARALFRAVTPVPDILKQRMHFFARAGLATTEQLCYQLLSPVWSAIELDYLLATTESAASILRGGTEGLDAPERRVELDACRAAALIGTLYRRLISTDPRGRSTSADISDVEQFDDARTAVTWTVLPEGGAVRFDGFTDAVPWLQGRGLSPSPLIVCPRTHILPAAYDERDEWIEQHGAIYLVSADCAPRPLGRSIACPDTMDTIDKSIVERLDRARMVRKR